MEATTPPNTSGFSRKPTRKNRKPSRSRKYGQRMEQAVVGMPSDMKAWLFGSIFLMAVAKTLAPMMGFDTTASSTTSGE